MPRHKATIIASFLLILHVSGETQIASCGANMGQQQSSCRNEDVNRVCMIAVNEGNFR